MPSSFICVVANGRISFIPMAEQYPIVYIHMPHLLCPFICWQTQVVSIPWLLWIMLLWTWEKIYLFEIVTLFPLDTQIVGFLDHMVILFFNYLRNLHTDFHSDIPINSVQGFLFSTSSSAFVSVFFFYLDTLTGVRGDISLQFWSAFILWLLMLSTFSCICWSCLLWKSVYSVHLPT